MPQRIIRFCTIVMAALVAGTIFGIWIGYDPKDLSAPTFIEQQQSAILALNTLMPILGLITILLTLTSAFLQRKNKFVFALLLVASVFFILSGITTRFGNQLINSVVMTWNMDSPPNNWMELRNQWWTYHELRTLSAFIGLCLIVWTNMKKN
ncbi:hypothetical protein C21_04732 [Arenibacter sp. NBRC 103722]|uniref:DUF1772 domain-containing protein n=1 Tax=Arenibacter sp. NBRC 103722 TaxID=1113929 RepID=UPI000855B1D7|nr:DUF1772 domain-containing protein [Arenibacter sp. NBRC 103722]GBF22537.1 hypothetical protein C21_04732 [Arenibacter sp. NBRC 103722]